MKISTKKIAISAMLIAFDVIFTRVLALNMPLTKIGLGFAAVMVCGMLYGPGWAAVCAGLGDLVGSLLFPTGAYFPGFTVTAAITGLVFGLLLYKKINFPRIVIAVLSTQLVCELLLNTLFISILYTKAFTALLATRAIQFVVMSVVEIIFAELALDRAKLLQKVKLA